MTTNSATATLGANGAGELVGRTPASSSHAHAGQSETAPKQNWILSPAQDSLLIILAPLLTLALALFSIHYFGIVKGATLVLVAHVVITVSHHLPTFIRIYGDVELFRRFRWHFVFAPIISLGFCLSVLGYLNANAYPLENFLYFYIFLTLWDPWHFARQHYGFMRIYDRNNRAPHALASRMDLLLSFGWFAYIMVASGDWLLDLLQDMYVRVQWPVLLSLTGDGLALLTEGLRYVALSITAAYLIYVAWSWRKGYFVSWAKLLMCLTTFGVMYLTYTPNALIHSLAPGWTFKVGFAVIGIVHMTQYLAIVWRFNRGLTQRPERARAGVFRWLHSRGAWWAAAAYVAICLGYGDIVTTVHDNAWLMAALLAIGFTSTMMHYYFDGFIWKVRHQQNNEVLSTQVASEPAAQSRTESWWSSAKQTPALAVLAKQLVYFALSLSILTAGAMTVWDKPAGNYIEHMYEAQVLSSQGMATSAAMEARVAFQAMQDQLPVLTKRTELQPTASRQAELAFLIYNESLYENLVIPQLNGQGTGEAQAMKHRRNTQTAIATLEQAMLRGGTLAHAGREQLTVQDAQSILESWRKQVG